MIIPVRRHVNQWNASIYVIRRGMGRGGVSCWGEGSIVDHTGSWACEPIGKYVMRRLGIFLVLTDDLAKRLDFVHRRYPCLGVIIRVRLRVRVRQH